MQTYTVAGEEVTVVRNSVEPVPGEGLIAVDTEGSGLDLFSPTFKLRKVQFGNRDWANVIDVDTEDGKSLARAQLHSAVKRGIVAHNATFDVLSLITGDVWPAEDIRDLHSRVTDTAVMSRLLDPRSKMEGGTGHGLKELCASYVDPSAPDTQGDLTAVFRSMRLTKATGFAQIDRDNDIYNLYAGLDVILTSRLFEELWPRLLRAHRGDLHRFEMNVQRILARAQLRGFKIDVDYAGTLSKELTDEAETIEEWLHETYGLENVNAPKQVAAALESAGADLVKRTKTGGLAVSSDVLEDLTKKDGTAKPLAEGIIKSKRNRKWNKAYVQAMLEGRDEHDHVHPMINGLQARTGRQSISNPPLQQLPSRGKTAWKIRQVVVPDEGMKLFSVDYDAIELRVLAALADVQGMKDAIIRGDDLHNNTVGLIYGAEAKALLDRWRDAEDEKDAPPEYREVKPLRNVSKMAAFLTVYGGGAEKLALQADIPLHTAIEFLQRFHDAYPEIRRYSRSITNQATYGPLFGATETTMGRYMPADDSRLYALLNYKIQGTAAEVLKRALIRIEAAGIDDHIMLPIHDEIIGQAPAEVADDVAARFGELMSEEIEGVPITASGGAFDGAWGEKYK